MAKLSKKSQASALFELVFILFSICNSSKWFQNSQILKPLYFIILVIACNVVLLKGSMLRNIGIGSD